MSEFRWLAINKQIQLSIYYMLININVAEKRFRSSYILTFFPLASEKDPLLFLVTFFVCVHWIYNMNSQRPFFFLHPKTFSPYLYFLWFLQYPKGYKEFLLFLTPQRKSISEFVDLLSIFSSILLIKDWNKNGNKS